VGSGNRPLKSLEEIFLPWLPHTNAPYGLRMRVLDSVLTTEPDIGWKLLASLLPSFDGSSMSTHKPRWRDSGASEAETVTDKIVYDTYVAPSNARWPTRTMTSQVVDRPRCHADVRSG
jgi:hypothetical protein